MGYTLLGLSALALAGAVLLLRADAQEKGNTSEKGTTSGGTEPETDTPDLDLRGEPQPQLESEAEREAELGHGSEHTRARVPEETVAHRGEPAETAEPEQPAEPVEPVEPVEPEQPAEAVEPAQPEEPEARAAEGGQKTHSRWGALAGASGAIGNALPKKLPGAKQRGRKERRDWADANGFDFAREDEFLQDEWNRGAASAGAPVRNVLTGTRFGHETRIADIGGTTVVAMGTGMDSGVVVDMRRQANAQANAVAATEDLVAVAEVEGFRVFGSEAGPVERMLDIRVPTALELLPPLVNAVWFESEWVLAELDGTPGAQEWEPVFAPLALLADAARTLPPRTWPHLRFEHRTREMGDPIEVQSSGDREGTEAARPVVVRPEEPLELPTRTTGGVRGTMEYRVVGGDEVDAIATGEAPEQLNDGTRITRRPQPPSIFGDSNRDYPG